MLNSHGTAASKTRRGHVASAVAVCAALGCATAIAESAGGASPISSPIWHLDGEGRGLPAADSSKVYFLSKRHEVLAVDASSGALRWKQGTGEPGDATLGSRLLLAGPVVVAGDYDVVALDRASGAIRWRFAPSDGYAPGIYLGEAAGGLVFTGSPSGRAYAIDQVSGRPRWSALIAGDGQTTVFQPSVDNDLVVAGYTTFTAPNVGGVVALDAATGRERWRAAFPRPSNPALAAGWGGGLLPCEEVVVAARGDGAIYAFDRRNGSIRWSIPRLSVPHSRAANRSDARGRSASPGMPRQDFRPLARTGRILFAGSLTGRLVAYDLDTRRERWRYAHQLNGSIAFSITSDQQAVYVPYDAGRLVALSISEGRERWRTGDYKSEFNWPAMPFGDRVYVATSAAGFFAFSSKSERQ